MSEYLRLKVSDFDKVFRFSGLCGDLLNVTRTVAAFCVMSCWVSIHSSNASGSPLSESSGLCSVLWLGSGRQKDDRRVVFSSSSHFASVLLLGVFMCGGSSSSLLARLMFCLWQRWPGIQGEPQVRCWMHIGRDVHLLLWLSALSSLPPSEGRFLQARPADCIISFWNIGNGDETFFISSPFPGETPDNSVYAGAGIGHSNKQAGSQASVWMVPVQKHLLCTHLREDVLAEVPELLTWHKKPPYSFLLPCYTALLQKVSPMGLRPLDKWIWLWPRGSLWFFLGTRVHSL